MNTYKKQAFFKLALRFGFIFFIVITLIKIVFSTVKNGGIPGMADQYFSADTWLQFVKIQLIMSTVYGLFMAVYYKFIKK